MDPFKIEYDAAELEAAIERARGALDTAVSGALADGAERVARRARSDHKYVSRTGNLSASTQAQDPTGSFVGESLEVTVEVTAPYAAAVMETTKDDFLARAGDAEQRSIARGIENAIAAALHGAGL